MEPPSVDPLDRAIARRACAPSRAMRERGTSRSKPAPSARSRVAVHVRVEAERGDALELPAADSDSDERRAVEARRSVRSTTSTRVGRRAGRRGGRAARARSAISSTSWPAAVERALHARPEQQVAERARARAPSLLRPQAAELLARRLRPAPHLHDLRPPAAHLAHRELALDRGFVEQAQRAVHRRRRRRRGRSGGRRAAASASRGGSRGARCR